MYWVGGLKFMFLDSWVVNWVHWSCPVWSCLLPSFCVCCDWIPHQLPWFVGNSVGVVKVSAFFFYFFFGSQFLFFAVTISSDRSMFVLPFFLNSFYVWLVMYWKESWLNSIQLRSWDPNPLIHNGNRNWRGGSNVDYRASCLCLSATLCLWTPLFHSWSPPQGMELLSWFQKFGFLQLMYWI